MKYNMYYVVFYYYLVLISIFVKYFMYRPTHVILFYYKMSFIFNLLC